MFPIEVLSTELLRKLLAILIPSIAKYLVELLNSRRDPSQPNEPVVLDFSQARRIGKFITYNKGFFEDLNELIAVINDYRKREKASRPMNILLVSPPGSGKSFLVEQLASELEGDPELDFEEYQVGALRSVEDLWAAYRRIQSVNLESKVPMVFLDEVDASVNDEGYYRHFLAPMASGRFYCGERSSAMGKAIFVFAASSPWESMLGETEDEGFSPVEFAKNLVSRGKTAQVVSYFQWKKIHIDNIRKVKEKYRGDPSKVSDFLDRIDWFIFLPPTEVEFERSDPKMESISIAMALIKKHFPVKTVEGKALAIIASLLLDNESRRKAEQVVMMSTPQGDTFNFSDLPPMAREDAEGIVEEIDGDVSMDELFQ